ncbi:hypothetical protein J4475_00995 [Candidatus Woesearchaeota archaeon]|nr:hypothetical protein [Candidatus Woesearchaeota archaeon]
MRLQLCPECKSSQLATIFDPAAGIKYRCSICSYEGTSVVEETIERQFNSKDI